MAPPAKATRLRLTRLGAGGARAEAGGGGRRAPRTSSRRVVLAGESAALGLASLGAARGAAAGADAAREAATLEERCADGFSIVRKPSCLFGGGNAEHALPPFLEGVWAVEATLERVALPLGARFAPEDAVAAYRADLAAGTPVAFRFRVQDGRPDRAFNTRESVDAYSGGTAVADVAVDASKKPLRTTVTFLQSTPGGRPLPPRRAETFVSCMRQSATASGDFVTAELVRQVSVGVRSVEATDFELIYRFSPHPTDGTVLCRQRSAVFLTPQDALYFDAADRAVALYDFAWRMTPTADA